MNHPKRLRLKGWLELESYREKIKESKSTDEVVEYLYSYLTLIYEKKNWDKFSWIEISRLFDEGSAVNLPNILFPLLVRNKLESDKKSPWDYGGDRTWYLWANALASKYGWTLEYIAELEIDDGIGLMQELLTDENLEKEWYWNLSEMTYSYNAETKSTKHHEYPWPKWMLPEPVPPAKTRIPKSMLPVGLIIGTDPNVKH